MKVYLDTHVVVLLSGAIRRLPKRAMSLLRRSSELTISPATLLELELLHEIGRLAVPAHVLLSKVGEAFPLTVSPESFARVATAAATLAWTRDPFDRLIVAQASLAKNLLLSKDATIRGNYEKACWD